jgi:hypothetical protein
MGKSGKNPQETMDFTMHFEDVAGFPVKMPLNPSIG